MAKSQALPQIVLAGCVVFLVRHWSAAFAGGSIRPTASAPRVALYAEVTATTTTDRLQIKLLSPEGDGLTIASSEVVLPSASGQLGVLANHAPMMTALDTGVIRYKQDGVWKPLVVLGGFATVENNQMSILVNDFETVDDIDADAAKKEMDEATAKLETAESKKDKLSATGDVKKAAARLQAAMFNKK